MGDYKFIKDISPAIFREYDIRGIVQQDLTPDSVYTIARVLGQEINHRVASQQTTPSAINCVIGYDGRHSSLGFAQSAAHALRREGINVIDIGMVPSPMTYFSAHYFGNYSALMITGSHNPKDYNGLKMMIGAATIFGDEITGLYERIQDFTEPSEVSHSLRGELETQDIHAAYIKAICEQLHAILPQGLNAKIVIDAGNGAAGPVAVELFTKLGCTVEPLYCDIDGDFPNHHPDPSRAENLVELQQRVQDIQADLGLAFDGDGDRLGVVTNTGTIIWPDRQLMALAEDCLRTNPGANIVFDVKCSRHLGQEIKRHGGVPKLSKTGHALIKHAMLQHNAPLAGELSGHIFCGKPWYGVDDALYAGMKILAILAQVKDSYPSSEEFFAKFPQGVATPELQIPVAEEEKFALVAKLAANLPDTDGEVILLDGVRIEWDYGWGLVRASNTTPCLTLRFEGNSGQDLERVKANFRELFVAVCPQVGINF